jgi:hypothetical protein
MAKAIPRVPDLTLLPAVPLPLLTPRAMGQQGRGSRHRVWEDRGSFQPRAPGTKSLGKARRPLPDCLGSQTPAPHLSLSTRRTEGSPGLLEAKKTLQQIGGPKAFSLPRASQYRGADTPWEARPLTTPALRGLTRTGGRIPCQGRSLRSNVVQPLLIL